MESKQTALYRFFNKDNLLLYVGISTNWYQRLSSHVNDKPWINEVTHTKIEWFDTTKQAGLAERSAIRWENPKYNKQSVVADSEITQHFQSLIFPLEPNRDTFHQSIFNASEKMIKESQNQLASFRFGNLLEWSILNSLWQSSKSMDEIDLPCKLCKELATVWWINEGHGIICDIYAKGQENV